MNDLEHDAMCAQLRAGDPYQGEAMPPLVAARIKARMRAAGERAHVRTAWMRAAAAAAIVGVVALGVWVGSRPSAPEQPLPASSSETSVGPEPAEPTPESTMVSESAAVPESVAAPELPPARSPAPADLTEVPPAAALVDLAETGPGVAASTETVVATHERSRTKTQRGKARRIQFTAPRGTRIIWTLDPDFDPTTIRKDASPARHQQGANDKW